MLSEITFDELREWLDYLSLEPIDTVDHASHRAGTIAAAIYNVNRGKNSKALTSADIFPRPGAKKPMDASGWAKTVSYIKDVYAHAK